MKNELKVEIDIYCPACKKKGVIKVQENLINKSVRGITAINVAEYLVCDHSFVAYIDNTLSVRDCFLYDFSFDLPRIEMEHKEKEIIPQNFDIEIVKYNIIPSLMVYIIKGILYGQKIVVIFETDKPANDFINFFKFLMKDTFKSDILFLSTSEYKKNKNKYKNHVVFQGKKAISKKDKSFDLKNVRIESSIIQNFFGDRESKAALIKFKNEFRKLYNLCQDLITFNNNLTDKEEFISKNALDYIYQNYQTRIPHNYLTLLTEIIENYFKVKLKKSTDTADLLGYL
jgi:hypothetical protein